MMMAQAMPAEEFVPVPPAGFDIAGTFGGVTTAVGQGGTPRIRYEVKAAPDPFSTDQPAGQVVERYLDGGSKATRYGGTALVKIGEGILEIRVTECDGKEECRRLLKAALSPYLQTA